MYPPSLLPPTLLFLLFTSPVLSAPTSPYDTFSAIATHARKPPVEPVCCLKPLTPLEPVADDLFLSFEDWKTKRSSDRDAPNNSRHAYGSTAGGGTGDGRGGGEGRADASADTAAPAEGSPPSSTFDVVDPSLPPTPETLAPHFRIPLTDRFNYASLDCSARVHTAHRDAKSAHNILSSKKDRYMLSPCAAPRQFVVVELCEDIWIDTVQLANYEFFSGVFREFTVSVAKTYATDAAGWTVAGTYTAKNTRGVQSFHPPKSLRDFYRFIRIDFHSHYGNEYYCPISLLRVYGLTHLEQWKWDIWEDESRARMQEQEHQAVQLPAEVDQPSPQPVQTPEVVESDSAVPPQPTPAPANNLAEETPGTNTTEEAAEEAVFRHSTDIARSDSAHTYTSGINTSQLSPSPSEPTAVNVASAHETTGTTTNDTAPSPSSTNGTSPNSSSPSSVVTSSSSSPPIISLAPSPIHAPTTGESIYRTIMNRLTALEANTTLYARYVEEQTAGMHEMLRRVAEDVGRLEGIGRVQAQLYQRSVQDFERQRRRMEVEQRELITRVKYLADEITLEKRLGIAQLCLLLAVLVFLSLTRGSRNDLPRSTRPRVPGPVSMKEWGKRNLSLSFSSDWVSRLRARSLTPAPQDARAAAPTAANPSAARTTSQLKPSSPAKKDAEIPNAVFPSPPSTTFPSEKAKGKRPAPVDSHTVFALASASRRPRTPSRRHPFAHVVHGSNMRTPGTPTAIARPVLQRSNSHSSAASASAGASTSTTSLLIGPVPRSAKRWARTAHLHEVRRPVERDENGTEDENGRRSGRNMDVGEVDENGTKRLRVDTSVGAGGRRRVSPLRMGAAREETEESGSAGAADPWVDTDAEGSEVEWAAGQGAREQTEAAVVGVFG
ncbi:UNC-like C-terminal-domain-containing protein [Amylostereum chailletii]|nr:UNC-like C-terminal-domain-containing protein [Amylostereum chailletii]